MKRIGIIGGLSWESTASYYALLNRFSGDQHGSWVQPEVVIDSLNFSAIVAMQRADDWDSASKELIDSAKRLEAAGATVLAISANTMHLCYDDVAAAVTVPIVDIRSAIANEIHAMGATSLALLGTKYVMEKSFYADRIEELGINVIVPEPEEIDALQSMIYDELTQGIVSETSRSRFLAIAANARSRGADVVGLCCTEFGLFVNDENAPWSFVDSTAAHVRALLQF